jgi:hypothetical protein
MNSHVGFSGSRAGMTEEQKYRVESFLDQDFTKMSAHHGDCIGADVDFHKIVRRQGLYVIGHPPIKDALRAFCEFDEIREPKDYLKRDLDIVSESDWMIFTPSGFEEILRSGTWTTIRYTRKAKKDGFIVFPDGTVKNVQLQKPV